MFFGNELTHAVSPWFHIRRRRQGIRDSSTSAHACDRGIDLVCKERARTRARLWNALARQCAQNMRDSLTAVSGGAHTGIDAIADR